MQVKQETRRWRSRCRFLNGIATVSLLSCLSLSGLVLPATAFAAEKQPISIEKPVGWKTGDTVLGISIDSSKLGKDVSVDKVEARVGDEAVWQDITENKTVTISDNQTVYIRVTDSKGNVYEQNRSIKCYDAEKPTLSAALKDSVLTIQGKDNISGIASITVNGASYEKLSDGQLKIQLTQSDYKTKKIEITAMDQAGNVSEKYALQNPYYGYKENKETTESTTQSKPVTSTTEGTQATTQTTPSNSSNTGSSSVSAPTTSTQSQTSSALPKSAEASTQNTARGTVNDRTVTGIEKQLEKSGESAKNITQTGTEGSKEFYTISTKSGKTFHLVIDNSQSQNNVYLLTEVSENDLLNFTDNDAETLPSSDTIYAEVEEATTEAAPEATTEEEVKMPEKKSSIGSYLMMILGALGVFGAGYYFKIYKPKHEYDGEDDGYDDENEEEEAEESEGIYDEYEPEEVLDDEDYMPDEEEVEED